MAIRASSAGPRPKNEGRVVDVRRWVMGGLTGVGRERCDVAMLMGRDVCLRHNDLGLGNKNDDAGYIMN